MIVLVVCAILACCIVLGFIYWPRSPKIINIKGQSVDPKNPPPEYLNTPLIEDWPAFYDLDLIDADESMMIEFDPDPIDYH